VVDAKLRAALVISRPEAEVEADSGSEDVLPVIEIREDLDANGNVICESITASAGSY
jgi:hypothetical protein